MDISELVIEYQAKIDSEYQIITMAIVALGFIAMAFLALIEHE
jgi:hypothetical protein